MTRPVEILLTNNNVVTTVAGLGVRFEIVVDMEGRPNSAVIAIRNAPLSLQAKLSARYTEISIRASSSSIFDNSSAPKPLVEIFSGEVIQYKKGQDEGKNVLHIIASDSQQVYNSLFISRSFTGPSATLQRILETITYDSDGLLFGGLYGVPGNYLFRRGLALCGTLTSVMQFFSVTFNADWYIDRGALYFVRRGSTVGAPLTTPITPETGLLDIPRATLTGIIARTRLKTELQVGGLVTVNASVGEGAGTYKTRRIEHLGNSDGSPWQSTLTLFRTEDEPPVKMRSAI